MVSVALGGRTPGGTLGTGSRMEPTENRRSQRGSRRDQKEFIKIFREGLELMHMLLLWRMR